MQETKEAYFNNTFFKVLKTYPMLIDQDDFDFYPGDPDFILRLKFAEQKFFEWKEGEELGQIENDPQKMREAKEFADKILKCCVE